MAEFINTSINCDKIEKLGVKFNQGTNARHIYHYTSIEGLKGIIENKKLHFANIGYMNDKEEVFAGLKSLAYETGADDTEYEKYKSALESNKLNVFVCCFSLNDDSLPMWNYYTKCNNSQGYNIKFNDKDLIRGILKGNKQLEGCDISFGQIEYIDGNKSKYGEKFVKGFFLNLNSSLDKLINEYAGEKDIVEKADQQLDEVLSDIMIYYYNGEDSKFDKKISHDFVYYIKRDSFIQEREVRIVITVPEKKLKELQKTKDSIYKFKISNGILIPYLELDFSLDAIKGITISPTVQVDLAEKSVEDFLECYDVNINKEKDFVKKSKIPVRY